jgi:uncharacterized SAM-binding protein YcdF (DUF218 family)
MSKVGDEPRLSGFLRRVALALVGAVVIGVISGGLLTLHVYQYGFTDQAAPANVIVILGAGSRLNGTITGGYARRARHGADLWRRGLAPTLMCTGGFANRWRVKSEAHTCQDYLIEVLGVPPQAILLETTSRSTEENAIEVNKVMQAHRLRTAILVTDNFHMLRAELFFREQGITFYPSPAQATQENLRFTAALAATTREVLALGWRVGKAALSLTFTDTPF